MEIAIKKIGWMHTRTTGTVEFRFSAVVNCLAASRPWVETTLMAFVVRLCAHYTST